jgi:GT2 family glycosyltransferase
MGARIVDVHEAGHLPPLIAGMQAAVTDVVAIFDDDAVPWPDCLQRLADRFEDDRVVAVGGPVIQPAAKSCTQRKSVRALRGLSRHGRTWYGGFQGLPTAVSTSLMRCSPVPCDHLTGANLAVRVDAVRRVGFDLALNVGAAIAWEADVCLGLRTHGAVVFDPCVVVDHLPAPRPAAPSRDDRERYAVDYSRNLFHIAAKRFGARELAVFMAYMFLVGQGASPGAGRTLVRIAAEGREALTLAARVHGARRLGLRSGRAARRAVTDYQGGIKGGD